MWTAIFLTFNKARTPREKQGEVKYACPGPTPLVERLVESFPEILTKSSSDASTQTEPTVEDHELESPRDHSEPEPELPHGEDKTGNRLLDLVQAYATRL